MSEDPKPNREQKAIDALITGTLYVWSPIVPTKEEISIFLKSEPELTESEKGALQRVHARFKDNSTTIEVASFELKEEMDISYMAMNRENAKDQIPQPAHSEIKEKRAKLIAQLKAKRNTAR